MTSVIQVKVTNLITKEEAKEKYGPYFSRCGYCSFIHRSWAVFGKIVYKYRHECGVKSVPTETGEVIS